MKWKEIFFRVIVLFMSVMALIACSKSKATPEPPVPPVPEVYTVTLNKVLDTLEVSDTFLLKPVFNGISGTPTGTFEWRIDDPLIVSTTARAERSVKITALLEGKTTVRFFSIEKNEELAKYEVVVETKPDGIIRVLAIGNSFSVDAMENYLHELATAAGKKLIIGNLSIAGGELQQHVTNFQTNQNPYNYTKIDVNGIKTTTFNNAIDPILKSERWDYISMQQVSQNSGMYSTFITPLPILYNYVKSNATNSRVKFILHQTWAYAKQSTHAGFANYNNDQDAMYAAIVETYNKAKDLIKADMIIPSGTAIQNGRTSFVGDNFTRDGYHLELSYGRYTAACTWFEKIFGVSVVGNSYKPNDFSDYYRDMAQHAAHFAVLKPNQVTVLEDFQQGEGGGDGGGIVQISFNGSGVGWNVISYEQRSNGSIPNLKDKEGAETGVSLQIVEGFNGSNSSGAGTALAALDIPSGVSTNSLFGNTLQIFNGLLVQRSVIKFSGLDKNKTYEFCFFGSRTGVVDNREGQYTCKGKNEVTVLLDAANNSSKMACASMIEPNDDGEIELTITAGPSNTNVTGFYYINALRITPGE